MKLNSIQFLRALAVLLVTYNHSIDIQMQFAVSWQQNTNLQKFGAIGVDLFFVISGFIISFVANKYLGVEQGVYFLKKRFIRINTIYYIASLLFLCLIIIRSWAINSFEFNLSESLSSFIDTILVIPVTETTATYLPLLRIGWTLGIEWFFYFLFFLLIIFKIKNKELLMIITIGILVTLGYLTPPFDLRFAFITNPIMLEFLLGTLIYWIYNNIKTIPILIPPILLTAGITCYILLIIYGYGDLWNSFFVRNVSMKRFFLWGVPSSFLVAGCIFLETNHVFKYLWNNNLIQLIGNASYSIYLVHLSAYIFITIFYIRIGFLIPPDASIIVQLFIAVLAGIGFYKIVEKPLLQAMHQKNLETIPTKSKKVML